jgi:hypothetical protein
MDARCCLGGACYHEIYLSLLRQRCHCLRLLSNRKCCRCVYFFYTFAKQSNLVNLYRAGSNNSLDP